jgi:hypothetical protein
MTQLKTIAKRLDKLALVNPDRLGLLYVRMNGWEWDKEILGKPYKGRDKMQPGSREMYEADKPYMRIIEARLGCAQKSMYWWTLELGKTKEEWQEWYYNKIEE